MSKELENLDIKGESGTYFIPSVSFDAESGICKLEGESYLEDTWEFYDQLVSWMETYIKTSKGITFNVNLDYFNTSSSKGISELLRVLNDYEKDGGEVKVNWYYIEDDEDMLEDAEALKNNVGIENMEIIPIEE